MVFLLSGTVQRRAKTLQTMLKQEFQMLLGVCQKDPAIPIPNKTTFI